MILYGYCTTGFASQSFVFFIAIVILEYWLCIPAVCIIVYVIVVTWALKICLMCMPEARGPRAYISSKSQEHIHGHERPTRYIHPKPKGRGCIYQANHECPWHNHHATPPCTNHAWASTKQPKHYS